MAKLIDVTEILKGGRGSGNFRHSGRPGKRGGSGGGGGKGIRGFRKDDKSNASDKSLANASSQSDKLSRVLKNNAVGEDVFDEPSKYLVAGVAVGNEDALAKVVASNRKMASDVAVADVISGFWAEDSNSSVVLRVQERASQLFGIELSDWQKGISKDMKERLGPDVLKDDLHDAASFATDPPLTKKEVDSSLDNFLNSTYDRTQKAFAEEGVTHVPLYRGFTGDFGSSSVNDRMDVKGNALESWTSDKQIGDDFAGYAGKGSTGITMETSVPVNKILGFYETGMGLPSEYVVISGNDFGEVKIATKTEGSDDFDDRDDLFL